MGRRSAVLGACLGVAGAVLGLARPAAADTKGAQWSDVGLVSIVLTAGNSDSRTGGITNTLGWVRGKSSFELHTRGYRVESTPRFRVATGPSLSDFEVIEFKSQLAAESYRAGTRFDRRIAGNLVWVVGGGWERNPFLGIHERTMVLAGVGNHWIQKDQTQFRTDYALTRTREQDVVDDPEVTDQFTGVRFSTRLQHTFTSGATLGHDLVVDQNLDRTKDLRGDMTAWVTFASGPHLALQAAVELLYDRDPALQEIPFLNLLGLPTGQNVLVPLKDLDTTFTTSLVLHF